MPVRKLAAVVATSIAALLAICSIAAAAPTVDGHFPTPEFDGSNAKIAAGPDGNMWMPVNEGEFDVARIAPDGSVTPFTLGPELENARGIATDRIVLAGFSQGGAMALPIATRYAEKLAGVIALSCYLPLADSFPQERHLASVGVPIFMAHGTSDPIVPLERGAACR